MIILKMELYIDVKVCTVLDILIINLLHMSSIWINEFKGDSISISTYQFNLCVDFIWGKHSTFYKLY